MSELAKHVAATSGKDNCRQVWRRFWNALENEGVSWPKQWKGEDLEQMVDDLLFSSVPEEPMTELRALWSPIKLDLPWYVPEDEDLWDDLDLYLCDPDVTTPENITMIKGTVETIRYKRLMNNDENESPMTAGSKEEYERLEPAIVVFVKHLKHTALCTAFNFLCTWSRHMTDLPQDGLQVFRPFLYRFAIMAVLRKLIRRTMYCSDVFWE